LRPESGTPTTDKLFTGHQKEGDLYYMKARFYDPLLGRFMAADSIVPGWGDPQSLKA
jgi:RHS repeat-associated protein